LNGIAWYVPHEGQYPFHKCESRERWIFGGNRSGKTEAGAAEVVMWILGKQNYRNRKHVRAGTAWVVSVSTEKQREVTQPKLLKFLPVNQIARKQNIQRGILDFIELKNGWRILFKNYSQDVDTFGGQDVDIIWFDEEPRLDIYKECLLRTIDRSGVIIGTMTPVKGMTWVYSDIWEKAGQRGIKCFMMDMDQNPHLSQDVKDDILAGLTEQEKIIRKEGKFVALQGLIYPKFNEEIHCIDDFVIPLSWRRIVGIDPHLKKATSVVWAAIATENYNKVKRGDYVIYREARRMGETPDIASMIQIANGPHEKIYCYVVDPSKPNVNEEWPGQTILDVYAAYGIPAQKANKAVEQGISAVRARLDATPPTLWIFKSCIGCIWEFKHYMYSDPVDQAGKPYSDKIFKKDDDYLDDIRYIVNTGIPPANLSDYDRPQMQYSAATGRPMGYQRGINHA